MAAVEPPLTRSKIETIDQTAKVLADLAGRLRSGAPVLERAADVYTEQMRAPNGSTWQGDTAASFIAAAHTDRSTAVIPMVMHAQGLADVSKRGSDSLLSAQHAALQAIAEAENDDFTVSDDLSVNDNYLWQSTTDQGTRQQAAVAYRNYIAHCAARLAAESTRIAGQLSAGAADMMAITPAHWHQPFTHSLLATASPPTNSAASPTALASKTAVEQRPPATRNIDRAAEGFQPLGRGGLKDAPGAEALSVHNSHDVHRIVDPLPPGRHPDVKTLPTPAEIRRLYEQLTENGKPLPPGTYNGEWAVLEDGTRIGYRPNSKWGGPTVEIWYPGEPKVDVHLPEREENPQPSPVPVPKPNPVPAPTPTSPAVEAPQGPPEPLPDGGGGLGSPSVSPEQQGVLEVIVGIGAAIVAGIGAIGEWTFSR